MRTVFYSKEAIRTLRQVPRNVADLIREKIERYAADPASLANNVKALKGSDAIRLRVGDWRVVMIADGTRVTIVRIGSRGSVYD